MDLNKKEDSTEAVNLHSPTPINSIITTILTIVIITILQKTAQGLILRTKTEVIKAITNLINSTIIKMITMGIIIIQIKILYDQSFSITLPRSKKLSLKLLITNTISILVLFILIIIITKMRRNNKKKKL